MSMSMLFESASNRLHVMLRNTLATPVNLRIPIGVSISMAHLDPRARPVQPGVTTTYSWSITEESGPGQCTIAMTHSGACGSDES